MTKLSKDVPILFPLMGEFGTLLHKHVPGVYGAPRPLVICHEEGYEALYPNATERWTYPRPPAEERKAGGNIYQKRYFAQIREHFGEDRKYIEPTTPFKWRKEYFVPQHQREYDCDFDVLLFARRQQYASGRNWLYWDEFHEALKAEGIRCLVAGQPDSTARLDCPAIWDLVDEPSQILDCTIWAIHHAKFRIGTPTGTTLLSQLCGKPTIILISDNGMDAAGSKMAFPAGYYYSIDHTHCGWQVIAHWMRWQKAVEEFLEIYSDQAKFEDECKIWVKAIHKKLAMPDPDQKWRHIHEEV